MFFFKIDFVSACENKLVSIPYVQHKASASGAQMTTEKNIEWKWLMYLEFNLNPVFVC